MSGLMGAMPTLADVLMGRTTQPGEPVNKLMMTPHQRMMAAKQLMGEQYNRGTPQDGQVMERAGLLPLGAYDNGQVGIAWPGLLAGPVEAANRLWGELSKPGVQSARDNPRIAEDAFEMAGGAATGSLLAPRPSNSVGIFGGRLGAENLAKAGEARPLNAIELAERMRGSGATREAIYAETNKLLEGSTYAGVHFPKDGKPRFEIDDSRSAFDKGPTANPVSAYLLARSGSKPRDVGPEASTLGEALTHKDLFAAYPDMPRIEFSRSGYNAGGYYVPPTWNKFEERMMPEHMGVNRTQANSSPHSVALHEGQHAVQHREGFQNGGSWRDFDKDFIAAERARRAAAKDDGGWTSVSTYDPSISDEMIAKQLYQRLAGEVEARAVQKRMAITPEQRRARAPWLDYDTPEANQIVRLPYGAP